jgi:sugar/nucleoside kinase (ribokinase family)
MQRDSSRRAIEAIVAGHICLDIIPALPPDDSAWQYRPGVLVEVGPAAVATGGCVSNAGQVLHRLGVATRLAGKVGDDAFGVVVRDVLARSCEELAEGLLVAPGEQTSYSVVIYPPGRDRMFLHYPGANDTFVSADIPDEVFAEGRIFHFGYPPLMARMYEASGLELARIMQRAKSAGLTTGLDMAYPDPDKATGKADWRAILRGALPSVDVFVPSLEEVSYMLGHSADVAEALAAGPDRARKVAAHMSALSTTLLDLGAGMVGIKAGDLGFYLRTASSDRLRAAGRAAPRDCQGWANREIWSSVFQVPVVGTVGAGDATVAGFIFGLLRAMTPEQAVTAACAVGASSVEAPDATSGVAAWDDVRSRIDAGWVRLDLHLGGDWAPSSAPGVWLGPHDTQRAAGRGSQWSMQTA